MVSGALPSSPRLSKALQGSPDGLRSSPELSRALRKLSGGCREALHGSPDGCLLYTSDAADDM
eukprot:11000969-Alexandrium_andersonii.AAC.1